MKEQFQFYAPMKIMFGHHVIQDLPKVIQGNRVFIVMDKFLYESSLKNLLDTLLSSYQRCYFTAFSSNPDIIAINQALDEIRSFQATSVIGIGGGSTLDISKFLAVAMNEHANVETLCKTSFQQHKKIKSICIPTTAGTGSEVTNVSVISNYQEKKKSPFVHDVLFADVALLDPQLTLSLPQSVTASCGLDTICHAIEAYWNKNATVMSDILAIEALKLALNHLFNCYKSSECEEARSQMLKASLFAGLAFAQTRTTILHAVSFPLTSKYAIPHGLACAILLPSFIRYYGEGNDKLHTLSQQLGYINYQQLASAMEMLMDNMGMKRKLQEHGIIEADIAFIAKEALQEKIALLGPKEVKEDTLIDLLKGVFM